MKPMARKIVKPLLIVFLLVSIWVPGAKAAVVGTESLLVYEQQGLKEELQAVMAREEVRSELVAMGVDPLQVEARIAALTDEELRQLQSRINDLPAGGGAIEIIGIVFLVLLILELVGVIDVFSKI